VSPSGPQQMIAQNVFWKASVGFLSFAATRLAKMMKNAKRAAIDADKAYFRRSKGSRKWFASGISSTWTRCALANA